MRENLHAVGMCLGDDGAIDARLKLRDIAVPIVHPDLHEAHTTCMQLQHVIASLSSGSRAVRNAKARLASGAADRSGCDALAHGEEARGVRDHLVAELIRQLLI